MPKKAKKPSHREVHFPLMEAELVGALTVPLDEVDERLVGVMQEYGMAIVSGVLTSDQATEAESLLAADISSMIDHRAANRKGGALAKAACSLKKQGVQSLSTPTARALGAMDRLQLRGLPHGRFAWSLRCHAGVRRVY